MSDTTERVLSIDEILAADDTTYSTIEAWGGKVRIGSLSAGSMLKFIEDNKGPGRITAGLRLLLESLVNERNERIGSVKLLEAFKRKNSKEVNMVVKEILTLNGLGPDSEHVDISAPLKEAGKDPAKLRALAAELHELGTAVEDVLDGNTVDEQKLVDVADWWKKPAKND
jgi:hypothetical protein